MSNAVYGYLTPDFYVGHVEAYRPEQSQYLLSSSLRKSQVMVILIVICWACKDKRGKQGDREVLPYMFVIPYV